MWQLPLHLWLLMGEFNIGWTLAELSDKTGVGVRTLKEWTSMGLIPAGHGGKRGVHRYYSALHMERIEDIKRLRDNNRTLADLVDYYNPEDDDDE